MSEAARTRVELIDRALENLGILVEGQSPTDTQRQKVDRIVDSHLAELRVEDIVYIADYGTSDPPQGGEFPAEYFLALANTLAWAAAPSFSLAGDPSLKVLDDIGRDALRRLTRVPRTRRALKCDPAIRVRTIVGRGSFTTGT